MDERFERLEASCNSILSGNRPNQKVALDQVLALWRKLHKQGVTAYDFAHALINVADGTMLHFDSMEEALEFGKAQKKAGEIMIRAVNEHWPPIQREDWPDDV